MNHVDRFRALADFTPVDRLPRWEWAMWWDKTIARWKTEGLPERFGETDSVFEIHEYFGLDPYKQFWFSTTDPTVEAVQHHVEGMVEDMDGYLRYLPDFYPDHSAAIRVMSQWADRQRSGDAVVWITLEGFFWFPRTLMGFTRLMLAYYDQPELIHRINSDLLEFNLSILDKIEPVCVPTFATIAEDMSYNNGPMISRGICEEFLEPYYRPLVQRLKGMNIVPIVDTDGNPTQMIPWLRSVGIRGVLPLERQAGVDGMAIRREFPDFMLIGHFDKMTMNKGADRVREEFERLLPLMRSGGFIPSVDHQTPPSVPLAEYREYLALLHEYTGGAPA
ncbi:MAG: hypothetical protein LBJ46_02380 [Planctomycetota bacterium]|jgi:hypothetical protein|nr:hypothetical protein [Planctomycetota bacterium]